jgi:hypothetical protein
MVKTRIVWTLVWVNVLLLVGLAIRMTSPAAQAQVRRPSDYVMIPGEISGGNSAVVYIIDTQQSRMAAVSYDDASNRFGTMPFVDLNAQFQGAAVGRRPGSN